MALVQTARGPVEAASLGRVLMHEHVFVLTAEVQQNYPEEWGDEDERVADAVRRLRELPANGISTIVDVTAVGQGRNIPRIKRIAEQVPELNIVVATGIYTFDAVPLFFSAPAAGGDDRVLRPRHHRGHHRHRRQGGHARVRGGHQGADRGRRAGAPLGGPRSRRDRRHARHHPHPRGRPARAGDRRGAEGRGRRPEPGRPRPLGDAVRDPDYLAAMADTGLTLGMDRFGIDHFATFQERSDLVVEMCRRGYAGRMVLAHDTAATSTGSAPARLDDLKNWHYLHVSQDVLPYLREHGVPESDIVLMLAANPARILAG